jgi:hypothetical protein
MDAKYAGVVSLDDALAYLAALTSEAVAR